MKLSYWFQSEPTGPARTKIFFVRNKTNRRLSVCSERRRLWEKIHIYFSNMAISEF